jgi:hypothetical protein
MIGRTESAFGFRGGKGGVRDKKSCLLLQTLVRQIVIALPIAMGWGVLVVWECETQNGPRSGEKLRDFLG